MLSSDAVVVRGGTETKVPASDIVPGDVVMLSLGDRVPADLRMIEVNNLACAEAALTGESVPIDKTVDAIDVEGKDPYSVPLGDRHNMCFSATLVAQGAGAGIIVATGDFTEIGTINSLVNKVEEKKTAVLEQIDIVSFYLACFIILTAIVTFCVAFFKLEGVDVLEAISIALVCAVAMIPEGLEAIVTVTYAWAGKHKKSLFFRPEFLIVHSFLTYFQRLRLIFRTNPLILQYLTWPSRTPLSVPCPLLKPLVPLLPSVLIRPVL